MSKLFEPISFRDVTFRNRIGVSPMCQSSCVDGTPTDWHLVHLGARALGGAGMVMTEAAAVEARGRISPADAGIYDDRHVDAWAPIAKFIKEHGAVPAIQLAHAGRKGSTAAPWQDRDAVPPSEGGWVPIAPSPEAFTDGYPHPAEMTIEQIAEVQAAFVAAANRAVKAGFELIEIHAAHGYLLHEFLSPLSNHRTDRFGGSFDNRVRLLLEVVANVRKAVPESLPLWVRISATDWVENGWSPDDSVELAKRLKPLGVDAIDCSTGGNVPKAKIPVGPNYQVPFAERIRKEAGIPTAAVGLITEAKQAEEIVASGQADIVLVARQSLRDPNWPLHVSRELGVGSMLKPPVQYGRAFD